LGHSFVSFLPLFSPVMLIFAGTLILLHQISVYLKKRTYRLLTYPLVIFFAKRSFFYLSLCSALIFHLAYLFFCFQNKLHQLNNQKITAHVWSLHHQDDDQTEKRSFFYTTGFWPKSIQNNPTSYHLVYEPGPPRQFIGKIIASWKNFSARILIEGPKTPQTRFDPRQIRSCFLFAKANDFVCYRFRQDLLRRFDGFLKNAVVSDFFWITVYNPFILPQDCPEGIWIESEKDQMISAYMILFSHYGQTQSFSLEVPIAEKHVFLPVFKNLITSFSLQTDLSVTRNQIAAQIAQTDLKKSAMLSGDQKLFFLHQVQKNLISQLSVDPKAFDAYYHLAGVTHLLYQSGAERLFEKKDLIVNLYASYQFAKDVSPFDHRVLHIESLWKKVSPSF
jgi:hypothetical protein